MSIHEATRNDTKGFLSGRMRYSYRFVLASLCLASLRFSAMTNEKREMTENAFVLGLETSLEGGCLARGASLLELGLAVGVVASGGDGFEASLINRFTAANTHAVSTFLDSQ